MLPEVGARYAGLRVLPLPEGLMLVRVGDRLGALAVVNNLENAADGNADPGWPVVQLVADFVDRFLEQEGVEQDADVIHFLREERRAGGGFQPAAQEGAAHEASPQFGPGR